MQRVIDTAILIFLIILCSVSLFSPLTFYAQARPGLHQQTVVGIESLGVVTFNTGFSFAGTVVGGLSGITYDANRGVYYVLSDDQSQTNPARYYTVAIDLSDRHLDAGDVAFQDVTTLLDHHGVPFPELGIDPEGIVLAQPGTLYISSEGATNAEPPLPPFVNRFNPNGRQTKALPVPMKFLPNADRTRGVRHNAGFESLTVTPDRRIVYTATEHALAQDGPRADTEQVSQSRILAYDRPSGRPLREFVYLTEAGLVDLVGFDNTGTLLALERSFTPGIGNTIKLFEARTQAATDVAGRDDLFDEDTETPASFIPVDKRLLADLADLDITPDNVEGMTLGPVLPDGRQTLILVSDNNFSPSQVTQFIALALEVATGW
jgi:3-phytase